MTNEAIQVATPKNEGHPVPPLTTADIVVLGEDKAPEQEVLKKSYEIIVAEGVESAMGEVDGWLSWKVKNELVAQICRSFGEKDLQIDIQSISELVRDEITAEKAKQYLSASRIGNETIPLALSRSEPRFDDASYYWKKDIPNLQARTDIHFRVFGYLAQIEATGSDGVYDLSETYIRRMLATAQDEVLAIIRTRKDELEAKDIMNESTIIELNATIVHLETQLKEAKEKLEDSDESEHHKLTLMRAA